MTAKKVGKWDEAYISDEAYIYGTYICAYGLIRWRETQKDRSVYMLRPAPLYFPLTHTFGQLHHKTAVSCTASSNSVCLTSRTKTRADCLKWMRVL